MSPGLPGIQYLSADDESRFTGIEKQFHISRRFWQYLQGRVISTCGGAVFPCAVDIFVNI